MCFKRLLPNLNTCGIPWEYPTHSKSSNSPSHLWWVTRGEHIFMMPAIHCMSFPWMDRKIPTYFCFGGVFVSDVITAWSLRQKRTLHQRCSACPSHCAKEQPSDRASMLEKGNPGEIHVRVAWKSGAIRGWVMRASVADRLTCRRQKQRQRWAQAAHVMLSTALLHSHWRRAESNASATLTTHNIHFLL